MAIEDVRVGLRLVAHAKSKGMQLGSATGMLLAGGVICTQILKGDTVDDGMMDVVHASGQGALVGMMGTGVMALGKIVKLSKEEKDERVERLKKNEEDQMKGKVAVVGGGIGGVIGGVKVMKMDTGAKEKSWDVFCWSMAGMGVAVVALYGGKVIKKKISKMMSEGGEKEETEEDKGEEAGTKEE